MNRKPLLARQASVHLDTIRGVSAVAVLLYHLRGLFFVDYPYLAVRSVFSGALYAVTGYGHQAVMVFFVLSGYFIGTSVIESVGKKRWSWSTYLVGRLARLQLVLFPALVLGALWDRIGMRIPRAAFLYYGGLYKFYYPSVALRSTVPVFFGNLLFLQSIVSPVFGSNGPLWSLSYEFWYYIVFPALVLASAAWVGARFRVLYAGLAVLLLWFVGAQITFYFLIWLAGAAVGRVQQAIRFRTESPVLPVAAASIFIAILAWTRTHRIASDLVTDYCVAFCFALWLLTLLLGARQDAAPAYVHTAKKLSGFSYSLYLTHFPLLLLLRALLDPQGSWQPDARHLAYAVAIGALTLGYAYCVAEVTEAHTAAARNFLLRRILPVESESRS